MTPPEDLSQLYQRVAKIEAQLEHCPERLNRIAVAEDTLEIVARDMAVVKEQVKVIRANIQSIINTIKWCGITFGGGLGIMFMRSLWESVAIGGLK